MPKRSQDAATATIGGLSRKDCRGRARGNPLIGRAAFETARRMYLRDRLEYRHGAQLIERSGDGDWSDT